MNLENCHFPVILMLSQKGSEDSVMIDWIQNSRFRTFEAANILDIYVEMSDFTIKKSPELIILHTYSFAWDLEAIKTMFQSGSSVTLPTIILFSDEKNPVDRGDYLEANLATIDKKLSDILASKISQQIAA